MSKLSFKEFLASDETLVNEDWAIVKKLFGKKDAKDEYELGPDGEPLVDKDGKKIKKLSDFAKERLAARANANAKDPSRPRSEKQANDALAATADSTKKAKTVLDPKTRSFR